MRGSNATELMQMLMLAQHKERGQRLTVAMPSELIAQASTAREGQLAIAYTGSVLAKQLATCQVR